ncbi:MAG: hypothetical protein HOV80_38480 [Polyangiaceae bacterium]|nr:hypothetical protein [Polyangiaceae bacterium]
MRLSLSVLFAFLLLGALAGCAPPPTYIRFVNATEAQLAAVEQDGVAWYEFQPGDEVPLNMAVLGVSEAAAEGIVLRAKKRFYIVVRRGASPAFSFDGQTIAYGSETFLGFGRDGDKNTLNVLTYLGPREEMPEKLRESSR